MVVLAGQHQPQSGDAHGSAQPGRCVVAPGWVAHDERSDQIAAVASSPALLGCRLPAKLGQIHQCGVQQVELDGSREGNCLILRQAQAKMRGWQIVYLQRWCGHVLLRVGGVCVGLAWPQGKGHRRTAYLFIVRQAALLWLLREGA